MSLRFRHLAQNNLRPPPPFPLCWHCERKKHLGRHTGGRSPRVMSASWQTLQCPNPLPTTCGSCSPCGRRRSRRCPSPRRAKKSRHVLKNGTVAMRGQAGVGRERVNKKTKTYRKPSRTLMDIHAHHTARQMKTCDDTTNSRRQAFGTRTEGGQAPDARQTTHAPERSAVLHALQHVAPERSTLY